MLRKRSLWCAEQSLDVGEDEARTVRMYWMSTQFLNRLHLFLGDFCGFHS